MIVSIHHDFAKPELRKIHLLIPGATGLQPESGPHSCGQARNFDINTDIVPSTLGHIELCLGVYCSCDPVVAFCVVMRSDPDCLVRMISGQCQYAILSFYMIWFHIRVTIVGRSPAIIVVEIPLQRALVLEARWREDCSGPCRH